MRSAHFRVLAGLMALTFFGAACGGHTEEQGGLGQPCYSDQTCDESFVCEEGTCVEDGGEDHGGLGQSCYSDQTCDESFVCEEGTCVEDGGEDHGGLGQPCYADQTCDEPFVCEEGTCVEDGATVVDPETLGFVFDPAFDGTISAGPYEDGTLVTIARNSGTFGAKDHQSPFYYSDIEEMPLNEQIPEPWSAGPLIFATNERAYIGSRSIRIDHSGPTHNGVYMPIPEGTEEFYFSARYWWEKYVEASDQNIKCFVLSSGPGNHTIKPGMHSTFGPGVIGYSTGADAALGLGQGGFGYNVTRVPTGQWHRREQFMRLSTPGEYDGIAYIKINQQGDFRYSAWPAGGHIASRNNTVPHTTYWGEPWPTRSVNVADNTLRSQFLVFYKRSEDRADHWVDEVYMDLGQNAQARIELGSEEFGTDSRPRNPCPYTAWSTDSITFRINAGPNGVVGRSVYFVNGEGQVERLGQFTEQ